MKPLPQLKLPIVRYYMAHLYTHTRVDATPHKHIFASFAQTEYSQLILTELSFEDKPSARHAQKIAKNLPLEEFDTIENFSLKLDDNSFAEMTILEVPELPKDLIVADLSEELIEALEIIYLFHKGAIFPGIHKLDMLIDMGVIAMLPLRELLSRAISDKLKINILAEYQLMNFDKDENDFIDFNLIWFLGKLNLQTVDKFLQEDEWHQDRETTSGENPEEESEEKDESYSEPFEITNPYEPEENEERTPQTLNEEDRVIKSELENELKRFYLTETQFFTRVVGIRHYDFDYKALPEGTRLVLSSEPNNPHDPLAVSVKTIHGEMIGYLKKELSEIMSEEIQQGVLYNAVVVKVLPEAIDDNSKVHLLVKKLTHHFN